ncbi:SGNH hydrolase [Macrolepiota fuliginosa MF-IS2]|uniref:SGNH hydrolase n=1 Tax=Macrolepiota fuliginosa MF-IS2 TaxID=1400762 RepID=A0A9P6C8I7_9AGAR|nr:SGNH hydrolase [Macrolepiota fuliginosa MF-IS2]
MAAKVQDVILLFGDSITQGAWEPGLNALGQRLSHVYARRLDVVNRGFSGYNTEWGLPVFEQCIAKREDKGAPRIQLLTIWFGANDACIHPSPQHIPLERFKDNIRKMVQMVKSPDSEYYSPWTRVILLTPPPVNTHQRLADLQSRNPPLALDRLFDTTKLYAQVVQEIGEQEGVAVVDVWTLLWDASGRDEASLNQYLIDGLHLNGVGYEVVYNQLMETIRARHPEVYYENLRPIFPWWADINWDNPNESLYVQKVDSN